MPFPTLGGSGTAPDNLSTAWTQARTVAGYVKEQSRSLRDRSTTQNVGASEILDYVSQLASWREQLGAISAMGTPMADYAKAQVANPAEDIVAEFNAMTAQIDATITTIVSTFPKDVNGNLLFKKWLGVNTGRTTDNQFTPADLASLRTQLNTLIATMN